MDTFHYKSSLKVLYTYVMIDQEIKFPLLFFKQGRNLYVSIVS